MSVFLRAPFHPGNMVLESFRSVKRERSPFASEATARAFLEASRALARDHLPQKANHGDGENAIEQARADASAYNESKRNAR